MINIFYVLLVRACIKIFIPNFYVRVQHFKMTPFPLDPDTEGNFYLIRDFPLPKAAGAIYYCDALNYSLEIWFCYDVNAILLHIKRC